MKVTIDKEACSSTTVELSADDPAYRGREVHPLRLAQNVIMDDFEPTYVARLAGALLVANDKLVRVLELALEARVPGLGNGTVPADSLLEALGELEKRDDA